MAGGVTGGVKGAEGISSLIGWMMKLEISSSGWYVSNAVIL
jgi:hypothetical protein